MRVSPVDAARAEHLRSAGCVPWVGRPGVFEILIIQCLKIPASGVVHHKVCDDRPPLGGLGVVREPLPVLGDLRQTGGKAGEGSPSPSLRVCPGQSPGRSGGTASCPVEAAQSPVSQMLF